MKGFGLLLIIVGILAMILGIFGIGGSRFGVNSLALLGIIMAACGFLLYRRNRARELPGRS